MISVDIEFYHSAKAMADAILGLSARYDMHCGEELDEFTIYAKEDDTCTDIRDRISEIMDLAVKVKLG